MEARNYDQENALIKLGGMIEPKKTGKYMEMDHVNKKPTDYKDMYAFEDGYHMLASHKQDHYPNFEKDMKTGDLKLA